MADLFVKQATQYANARPCYPQQLFDFIASKTPCRDVAWDVGTGNGQAAQSLAEIYGSVIATDTSLKQLELAGKRANLRYQHTPPTMTLTELQRYVSPQSTVDLVTIAQALHWFDLSDFYGQARWVLKKPSGVIAAWCYSVPEVNPSVDSIFRPLYAVDSHPYWNPARDLVDQKYETIDFPFDPVEGMDHTGPFKFVAERIMDLEDYFTYIRSWSAYQTARDMGVELLSENVVEKFRCSWNDGAADEQKLIKFPIFLRIGRLDGSMPV